MSFFKSDDEIPAGGPPESGDRVVPLLPLRDIVVFPTMVVPLFVGRPKSIKALEEAVAGGRELLLAAQRNASKDEPDEGDIHRIGTLGSIIQLLRLPDQTVKVLVEGKSRAKLRSFTQQEPHFACSIEVIEEVEPKTPEMEALIRSVHTTFENYVKLNF
jgi:ATP-dependent Lon protease